MTKEPTSGSAGDHRGSNLRERGVALTRWGRSLQQARTRLRSIAQVSVLAWPLLALLLVVLAVACSDSSHEEATSSLREFATKGASGSANGQSDYCNDSAHKCDVGEGDCDSNAQCVSGLVCVSGYGPRYGLASNVDVCMPNSCKDGVLSPGETAIDCGGGGCGPCAPLCSSGTLGSQTYCAQAGSCLCGAGQGDCDSEAECQPGMKCVARAGAFELADTIEVCEPSFCTNNVLDSASGETGVDCGGPCGPCFGGDFDGGVAHACAIAYGKVRCWGNNNAGQLGDGTLTAQSLPTVVPGLTSNYRLVAAGRLHSCAVSAAGALKCWGDNSLGQLGSTSPASSTTPLNVPNAPVGITRLRAGLDYSCALTSTGSVWCWGDNSSGQLGTGVIGGSHPQPIQVSLGSSAVDLAVGANHACAALANGTVQCWGLNANRQLGNGLTSNSGSPVTASGVSGAVRVATGDLHSCAATLAGAVYCWGNNGVGGQNPLGIGPSLNGATPTLVASLSGVTAISASGQATCAVVAGGAVRCWGFSAQGQVGAGTTLPVYSTPTAVAGLSGVRILGGGADFMCALEGAGICTSAECQGGRFFCWGNDQSGALAKGTSTATGTPRTSSPPPGTLSALSSGDLASCAISSGQIYCWGSNDAGQLGDGTDQQRRLPTLIAGYTNAISVAAGGKHGCAALANGSAICWGSNNGGQLGNGTTTPSLVPVPVSGLGGASKVYAGLGASCALLTDGTMRCWGNNSRGALGNGTTTDSSVPVAVNISNVSTAAFGQGTACVVVSGAVYCWGDNRQGQVGSGVTSPSQLTPAAVVGLPSAAARVAVGQIHACALLTNGQVYCWGNNASGQLGTGNLVTSLSPVQVQGLGVGITDLSTWGSHTCARLANGNLQCWGENRRGQVGNGLLTDVTVPFLIGGSHPLIAAGGRHTCAQHGTMLQCWGYNDYGQLSRNTSWLFPVAAAWTPDYTVASGGSGGAGTGGTSGSGGGPGGGGTSGGTSPGNGCSGQCGAGEIGCQSNVDCLPGTTCSGRTPGSTTANVCIPPECTINPQLAGCGYTGAPCGPSCTANPTCNSDQDCGAGYICGQHTGFRYGQPGANVCEPATCRTSQYDTGCGAFTAPCGLCNCVPTCLDKHCGDTDVTDTCGARCSSLCSDHDPAGCTFDSDCQPGSVCGFRLGPQVGHAIGSNACLPSRCFSGPLQPSDCGTVTSPCGTCVASNWIEPCTDRECGTDPVTGDTCGSACPAGAFCNSSGHCAAVDATAPIAVLTPSGNQREIAPAPAPPPVAGLGATAGEFSVSDRGSATYTIPIVVPPGRAGIEPSLALRYSSSTGNGALGAGFSVDGFSTIQRCQRTYAQDGFVRGVMLDSEDAVCLDGQRLVSVAANEYRTEVDTFSQIRGLRDEKGVLYFEVRAKDGRILKYGTTSDARGISNEGIIRVWALNRVEDRSGNFMSIRYRATAAPDWGSAVAQVSPGNGSGGSGGIGSFPGDTGGGGMTASGGNNGIGYAAFTFDANFANELLPESISYTGNGNQEGDRDIRFEYVDTRADKIFGFSAAGGALSRSLRLERITASASGQLVRSYNLIYETAPNSISRIHSIQECAGTNPVCKSPTILSYFDEEGFAAGEQFNLPKIPNEQLHWVLSPVGTVLATPHGYDRLLVNSISGALGVDMPISGWVELGASLIPSYGAVASAALEAFNYFYSTQGHIQYKHYSYNFIENTVSESNACGEDQAAFSHVIRSSATGEEKVYDTCSWEYVWMLDLDGDGIQDRLWCAPTDFVSQAHTVMKYKLAKGIYTGLPPTDAMSEDGSILIENPTDPDFNGPCDLAPSPAAFTFDVDGDGTGNLVYWRRAHHEYGGSWRALKFEKGQTTWMKLSDSDLGYFNPVDNSFFVMDVNGDGLHDILSLPNAKSTWTPVELSRQFLWVNDGRQLRRTLLTVNGDSGLGPRLPSFVVDYDHDGIEELLQPNDDSDSTARPWLLRRIRGGVISSEEVSLESTGYPGSLGDFDGDGNIDLLNRPPGEKPYFILHRGSGRRQNLLKTVTDGFGRQVEVKYDVKDVSGSLVYTPAEAYEGCNWPTSCLPKMDHALVSAHVDSHLVDAVRHNDAEHLYKYTGARVDSSGGGWLGFDSRTVVMNDGAGQFVKKTEIKNRPVGHSNADDGWEAPYTRVLDGLISDVTETFAPINSPLTDDRSPSGVFISKRTHYDWIQKDSAHGRTFPAIRQKITEIAGDHPFHTLDTNLNRDWSIVVEDLETDAYGNVIERVVTSQELDVEDSDFSHLQPEPLPESRSVSDTKITFRPTALELSEWLISLPKAIDVIESPRCPSGTGECPSLRKTGHSDLYYRENGLLERTVREFGDPELELTVQTIPDAFGNVEQVIETDASGVARGEIVAYDERRLFPVAVTNDKDQTTQFRYDDRFGALTSRVDPNGIDETFSYDDWGILRYQHGPSGDRNISYEPAQSSDGPFGMKLPARYRVVTADIGGAIVKTEYNSLGQAVRAIATGLNGAEVLQEFEYDSRNRLSRATRPHLDNDLSQSVIQYQYDAWDRVVRTDYPGGRHTERQLAFVPSVASLYLNFVQAGSLIMERFIDANGHATQFERNRDGLTVRAIDPRGEVTSYSYGAFGTPAEVSSGGSVTMSYDADAYGRVKSMSDLALGGLTSWTYNGFDQPVSIVDPLNRVKSLFYDQLGRIDHVEDPDGDGTTKWNYDGDGSDQNANDANQIGRLVQTISPSGQRTHYTYEPPTEFGNRGLVSSVTQTLVLPAATASTAPVELTTTYHHKANSPQIEKIDYPATGNGVHSVVYGFDGYGHNVSARSGEDSSIVYWQVVDGDQGYRIRLEQVGDALTEHVIDPLTGETTAVHTTKSAQLVQSLSYGYDDGGNLLRREDHVAGRFERFDYDEADRLLHVYGDQTDDSVLEQFEYVPHQGSLFFKSGVGEFGYSTEGRDWVSSAGNNEYSHDGLGNINWRAGPGVPGGSQELQYTSFGLPSHIVTGTSSVTDLAYDADGNRVVKQAGDKTTYYAGDLYQAIVSDSSTTDRFMVYAGGKVVAQLTEHRGGNDGSQLFFHSDILGSIQTTTGTQTSSLQFEPFGSIASGAAVDADAPYGFTAQEHDSELGLINMHGRMYDPVLGQFMSPDPVMQQPFGQGLDRFAYVLNSPLNYTDPSGFNAEPDPYELNGRGGPGIVNPITIAGVAGLGVYGVSQLGSGTASAASGAIGGGSGAASALGAGAGGAALSGIAVGGQMMTGGIGVAHIFEPGGLASPPQPKPSVRTATASSPGVPTLSRTSGQMIAPVQEGTGGLPALQPRPGLCGIYGTCLADNGSFGGGGASDGWDEPRSAIRDRSDLITIDALARLRLLAIMEQQSATFSKGTIDDVVGSAARARGHTTEGARAITKKHGHARSFGIRSAFEGVSPSQTSAEAIIRSTLTNPSRTVIGQKTIDAYNSYGQGVRFERGTNRFVGFLEEVLASR
jgi:RHS repeat-associated protein